MKIQVFGVFLLLLCSSPIKVDSEGSNSATTSNPATSSNSANTSFSIGNKSPQETQEVLNLRSAIQTIRKEDRKSGRNESTSISFLERSLANTLKIERR